MQHSFWLSSFLVISLSTPGAALAQINSESVSQEVKVAVTDFLKGFDTVTCENGSPVSRYARDQTIYVDDAAIYRVSLADYDREIRQRACRWKKHEAAIDEIVVDVHAPNVATAAWTWHDTVTRKDGSVRRAKGAVLQTWVKDAAGWKIAATKGSEDDKSTVIDPPPTN